MRTKTIQPGDKIGGLTAVGPADPVFRGWVWRCDCGNEVVRGIAAARASNYATCFDCYRQRKHRIAPGMRYGRLTAVKSAGFRGWLWQCDCGGTVLRPVTEVEKAADPCCRECYNRTPNLLGTEVNGYIAVEFLGVDKYRNSRWLWRCRCGQREVRNTATHVRNALKRPRCCGGEG
jgi:hypothetical protein